MERAHYFPPKGHPPFEFSSSGDGRIFMPPDQWWKKVKQEYDVGILMHPQTGKPRLDPKDPKGEKLLTHKQVKKVWVVDEERNKLVKEGKELPPENWLELSPEELKYLGRQEFKEWTQYLKHESEVLRSNRRNIVELQRQGERELAALHARIAKAKANLEAEADEIEAKVRENARIRAEVESGKRKGS